jgi:hypothetical protein
MRKAIESPNFNGFCKFREAGEGLTLSDVENAELDASPHLAQQVHRHSSIP